MKTPSWSRRIDGIRPDASLLIVAVCLCFFSGCATISGERAQSLVPTRYQVRTGPFLVYSNSSIAADSPTIKCLHSLESDLANKLGCRTRAEDDPVEIYILDNRENYMHFLKFYYPELPPRRAFFLAQGDRRVVYTYTSDRLEEDLRHEATHALVRGYYGDVQLWLDEGIAEYFEHEANSPDDDNEHLAKLPGDLKRGWKPDMARLESLTNVHQMDPRDYRESWAWVRLMLDSGKPGESVLIDYLNRNRTKGATSQPPLSRILAARGTTSQSLLAHLETLQTKSIAQKPESPTQDRLFRFQNQTVEPHEHERSVASTSSPARPTQPPRPGFFRRLGALLNLQ